MTLPLSPSDSLNKYCSLDKVKPSVAFAHLGCEKNRVDTEHMLGLLTEAGYRIARDESEASVVVVNTCSFIQEAREESVKTLVEFANQGKELIISGCLAQHFQEELLESLPEAKAIIGTGDYQHIVEVLQRVEAGERVNKVSKNPSFVGDAELPRIRTTGKTVAYIKVAEGCNYRCAFCIIPKLRGAQRSRTIESIIKEAKFLSEQGVKELILISQITTNYGMDLYGKPCLADLLRALGEVDIPWIRVHYAYPTGLTQDVLKAFKEVPNVLPYFDLPLQHSHPEVLQAMNRPWQSDINTSILNKIRDQLPDAVLRTSLIVGFPGETESQFHHLASFVEEHRFDHVGVFIYSPEEGTKAATLPNRVQRKIAEARKDKIISLQQPIATEKNQAWIGRTVDILVEKENSDTGEIIGRCSRFAPEVDGYVVLKQRKDQKKIKPGMFVPGRIIGADLYDLTAELVDVNDIVSSFRDQQI